MRLKPDEFIRLTYRVYYLMREGYDREMNYRKDLNLEHWRQARLIAFYSGKTLKNVETLFDFLPLPGDPSLEEFNKAEAEKLKAAMRQISEYRKQT